MPIDYHGELAGKREYKLDNGSKLELRYNGHQSVLPPSQHPETGRYKWLTPPAEIQGFDKITYAKIPYAPQWMIDALLIDQRPVEQISSSNPESDRAWAIEYMSAIATGYPSDDYQDWIRVGMALKFLGDDLFPLWDSWSSTSAKYDGGKIQKKWDSFKTRDNRIATLGWFAKKAGWVPKTPKKSGAEMSQTNGRAAAVADGKSQLEDFKKKGRPRKVGKRYLWRQMLPLRPELEGLRFNEMSKSIELKGKSLQESDIRELRTKLEDIYEGEVVFDPYADFEETIETLAKKDSYHPVKDYFEESYSANFGKVDHDIFDQLLTKGLGVPHHELYVKYLAITFVGAVRRIYEPGCQHDTALVFQGAQGAHKTTFFRMMAIQRDWFCGTITDVQNTDQLMKLRGRLIVELAEIEQITSKKEDGAVKAFISESEDEYRRPYGRNLERHKRNCVLVGTVNQVTFLKDETGSRRYLIIPNVNNIDIKWVEQHKAQIWGAAVALYRGGYQTYLSKDDERLAQELNRTHEFVDEWTEAVLRYAALHQPVAVSEILLSLGLDVGRQSKADVQRVRSILQRAGWVSKTVRVGAGTAKRWTRENVTAVTAVTVPVTALKPAPSNVVTDVTLLSLKYAKKRVFEDEGKGEGIKTNMYIGTGVTTVTTVTTAPSKGFSAVTRNEGAGTTVTSPPLQLGQRVRVKSVGGVGLLKDLEPDLPKPARVDFDPEPGASLISGRFSLDDLEVVA